MNSSTIEMDQNLTLWYESSLNSTNLTLVEEFPPGGGVTTNSPPNATEVPPLKEYDFLNPGWNVAFSATVITGTLGNLIVLWIVLGK